MVRGTCEGEGEGEGGEGSDSDSDKDPFDNKCNDLFSDDRIDDDDNPVMLSRALMAVLFRGPSGVEEDVSTDVSTDSSTDSSTDL